LPAKPSSDDSRILGAQAGDELARCSITLLLAEPFFAHILGAVTRIITDEVETMGVAISTGRPQLYVCPRFLLKDLRAESARVAVLKHEILHLLFKHPLRDKPGWNPDISNLAADLVVNQYIGNWKLPAGAVTIDAIQELYPGLELEAGMDLDYYYKKLMSFVSDNGETFDDLINNGNSKRGEHHRWGAGIGDDAEDSERKLSVAARLAAADGEINRIALLAEERMSASQRGLLPGALQQMLQTMKERLRPSIDWKRALRIFASASGRTRVATTMKRRSRRFGTFPGVRIRRYRRLVVVIDTSGSISDDELSLFFREIDGMLATGSMVTIVECDAKVQRSYPYTGKWPEKTEGHGGTDFDPAFSWINERRSRLFDACLYLTDGYSEAATIRPYCKLLWVVTPEGNLGDHLRFGQSIRIRA
jgi:predicted metal-dependent peptidase